MKTGLWLSLTAAVLFGLAGCSGSGENNPITETDGGNDANPDTGVTPDTGVPDTGIVDTDGGEPDSGNNDTDAGITDAGDEPDGGPGPDECAKAANVAKKQALIAAQPVIGTRSKQAITATVTFVSVAGDDTVNCPVSLKFKDLNGNGTVEAYENWTLTAQARATDLVGRMSADQKIGLMAHATLADVPSSSSQAVSAATDAVIAANIRFGRTAANTAQLMYRATWANNVQEKCEASALGIPFVLSSEPAHTLGNGRTKAKGFSHWPTELGLAATNSAATVEGFGRIMAQDYKAIGIRMALSPSADLATDPRWYQSQFTFGEDSTQVGDFVAAYIKGAQGTTLGPNSVACIVKHFPGAGPAKGGLDARLEKGKYVTYPGNNLDAHLAPFKRAFDAGVAGVMSGYGVLETGTWSALSGILSGASIEQVGASYNSTIISDVLRQHYAFTGLVLAPWGLTEDKGVSPLGAPWGMETATKAARIAKAVNAGVDQFGGLNETTAIAAAKTGGLIADAQIDAAAARALVLPLAMGLFENPYVDAAQAAPITGADATYQSSLAAMNASLVLVKNDAKPSDWLNGQGDGTQTGDPGNAGNGSGLVLPAPPGAPYIAAGCRYYIAGNFDLDYVRSICTGYGEMTNDEPIINGHPAPTAADRMAMADYVFVRVSAPFLKDSDSGALNLPTTSLEYASTDSTMLSELQAARNAINARPGSKAQIVVIVDSGRLSVLSEILSFNPSAVYIAWTGIDNSTVDDKVILDVAFGVAVGSGVLPMGVPLSNAAVQAATQKEDLAGDGQHATFVKGFGIPTTKF